MDRLLALLVCALGALGGCEPGQRPTDAGGRDPRLDRAIELVGARNYPAACALLDEVVGSDPDSGEAEFYLGLAHHQQHRYPTARSHFERALRLGPTFDRFSQTYHFYGWCLYYLGDLGAARQAFAKHLESHPEVADSHSGLGRIDFDEGRLDDAEKRFRAAIALETAGRNRKAQLAKFHVHLADVYLHEDRLEDARRELLRSVELVPKQRGAYFKLYQIHRRRGEEREAARALKMYAQY